MLSVSVKDFVESSNRLLSGVGGQGFLGLTGLVVFSSGLGGSSSENYQIKKRVSSESVGSVDGSTGSFSARSQSGDKDIVAIFVLSEHLSLPVSGNSSHVVMNGRQDRDRLLGGVDSSEDLCGFENSGKSLVKGFRGQVVQVKMNMILEGSNTSSFENLDSL